MDFSVKIASAVHVMQRLVSTTHAELEAAKDTDHDAFVAGALVVAETEGRLRGQREQLLVLASVLGFEDEDWYQRLQEWADEETERYINVG